MKLALLSDIHGNVDALRAVLEDVRAEGVTRVLCCGDIVGYYYAPDACLDLLAEWRVDCVRGNHENMLSSILVDSALEDGIRRKYGSGLAVARDVLSPAQRRYLLTLPTSLSLEINGKTIFLGHGAPWDPDYYVYPDAPDEVIRRCAVGGEDYVVLGHTHYQMAIRSGSTCILNPGSVGQARGPGRGVANWAWLDLDTGEFRHRSTSYSTARLVAEIEQRDPDVPYLRTILERSQAA